MLGHGYLEIKSLHLSLFPQVGNQEAVDVVLRSCANEKKPAKLTDLYKDDNDESYGHVNVSPSSKLRRITLVKQQKRAKQQPPSHQRRSCDSRKGDGVENEFHHEIDGPPSKLRRISLINRINPKLNHPNQENNSSLNGSFPQVGLVAACKELANLAVSRGSLDDITVMIIDLTCFRCNSDST